MVRVALLSCRAKGMFRALHAAEYSCSADANSWINKWFGDCVYTTWDTVAFCIGLSSVLFWIIAQLPQVISNFLRSAADALSPWFLAQWLAGDTFNFLGCILTGDQQKTQTITAGYFIFSDIVIITQYIYYQIRNKNRVDFDESTHKGSAFSDGLKSGLTREKPFNNLTDQSIYLEPREDDSEWHVQSVSNAASNKATGGSSGLWKQVGRVFDSSDVLCAHQSLLPSAVSDLQRQDSWMYEHRHRLQRLAQEYGLEYGQATTKRLSSLYKTKRQGSHGVAQFRSSSRAHDKLALLKKPRYKAMLGITGLFGMVSTTKLQGFSAVKQVGAAKVGFTLSRRALLAFHESGTTLTEKGGLPVHFADQLLLGCHRAYGWTKILGRFLGWVSSALYLGSRLSQLVKNKQRRSADGLSLGMVSCAVLANLMYGTSIIMRGPSWDNLIGKAPWLIGSFGTIFLDFSIVIQAYYYSRWQKKDYPNEYTPLLA